MASPTLYSMKEDMATLRAEMAALSDSITARAADPKTPIDDLKKDGARLDDLNARYEILQKAHDKKETEDRAAISAQNAQHAHTDPETARLQARGDFYRAALLGSVADVRQVVQSAYSHLGAIPEGDADLGGGEHLLPVTLGSEIVSEPFEDNPMRAHITVSNATRLILPKLDYTIEDDDFITDKETAKEMEIEGDEVVFGRFKNKIYAKVSDTVLHGTSLGLQAHVDGALRSGLAAKEKKAMFHQSPAEAEAHMSYYSAGIKSVSGSTMLDAIIAAYGDLGETFRERAKVAMRRTDYISMIRSLSNGSAPLWGAKPEDIIGIPTIFVDGATVPVVGDFRYAQLNYENGTVYDVDKDVKAGVYLFVVTAWYDVRLKLKSAFRLATTETVSQP